MTMDETWLCHHDPDTKQQSMEWRHSGSPRPPKNPECKNPLEKFLSRFFLDQDGILLIEYLPKGQTIKADILKEKVGRGKVTKGVLFLHDNAPAHRPLATRKILAYLDFQNLNHPPYSPDLAPSNYHLFHGLKKSN